MKRIDRFLSVFLFCVFLFGISVVAEEITLTTYYPAPYGAYNELSVSQSASTSNNTSALNVVSTDADITVPAISVSSTRSGALLDSSDSTTSYYLLNLRSGAATTSRFYVRNDGNVGIGTTDPKELLDVNGGVMTTGVTIVEGEDVYAGADGSFITADGQTVTVKKGIIVSITGP